YSPTVIRWTCSCSASPSPRPPSPSSPSSWPSKPSTSFVRSFFFLGRLRGKAEWLGWLTRACANACYAKYVDGVPPPRVLGQPGRLLLLHLHLRPHPARARLGQPHLLGLLYVFASALVRVAAACASLYALAQSD